MGPASSTWSGWRHQNPWNQPASSPPPVRIEKDRETRRESPGLWGQVRPSSPLGRREGSAFLPQYKGKEDSQTPTMPQRLRALPKSSLIPGAKGCSPVICLLHFSTVRKKSRAPDIHSLRSRIILECKDWYPLQAWRFWHWEAHGNSLPSRAWKDLVQHEWEEDGGQLSHPRSRWPLKATITPASPVASCGDAQKSALGQKPKVCPGCCWIKSWIPKPENGVVGSLYHWWGQREVQLRGLGVRGNDGPQWLRRAVVKSSASNRTRKNQEGVKDARHLSCPHRSCQQASYSPSLLPAANRDAKALKRRRMRAFNPVPTSLPLPQTTRVQL